MGLRMIILLPLDFHAWRRQLLRARLPFWSSGLRKGRRVRTRIFCCRWVRNLDGVSDVRISIAFVVFHWRLLIVWGVLAL
jgi:hypothetical protein